MLSFLAFISAIGAAWAAIAAWKTANETKNIVLAQIINDIRDQFSTDEINDCIIKLIQYNEKHGDDIEDQFFAGLALAKNPVPGSDLVEEVGVDHCRRKYSHIFHKLVILLESKCIDEIFLRKVIFQDEVDLLINIVEPLEKAKADFIKKKYNSTTYDIFRKLFQLEN